MDGNKRLYIVTLILLELDKIMTCTSIVYPTKDEARNAVLSFAKRWTMDKTDYLPSYGTDLSGKSFHLKDGDTVEHDTRSYYASYDDHIIDPEDCADAVIEYTIDMCVQRTYNISVNVEAESEADAEEKALENLRDGDYEHQIECFDDEDVDIESCYES